MFGRLRDAFKPATDVAAGLRACRRWPASSAGDAVEVDGDEAHHAVAVRRLRVGEQVVLTDGAGHVGDRRRVDRDRQAASVRSTVAAVVDRRAGRCRAVVVVQALPKGDRGELAVEMLTEVGVDADRAWAASRSVAVWRGERAAKSLRASGARPPARPPSSPGGRGSRRSTTLASTADVVALLGAAILAVVLHEEASVPLAVARRPGHRRRRRRGRPRGRHHRRGARRLRGRRGHPVRLGAEVLRTSTAGVAAAAALLARTPRWS